MTSADIPAFLTLMHRLNAAFKYQPPLSERRQVVFFVALADLELDEVCVAVGRAVHEREVRELHYIPVPRVLRELVRGTPEQRDALAWATVKRLVRWPSILRMIELCNATLIEATVAAMGGWEDLERYDRLDPLRDEFVDLFRALENRPELARGWYARGRSRAPDALGRRWGAIKSDDKRTDLLEMLGKICQAADPWDLVREKDALVVAQPKRALLTSAQEAWRIEGLQTVFGAAGRGGLG